MNDIQVRVLSCGMPIIVEPMAGVRSAALTWLIPAGSAADPEDRQGLCTMWSELLFRGAGDLDSRAHADALDRMGATRAADVGTHHLRLSVTALGDRMLDVAPLVADMVLRPRFSPEAIEAARALSVQALESLRDEPRERALLAARSRHRPAPLNRSGMGTSEGLAAVTRQDVVSGWSARARPGGSILAVAGAVDPQALAERFDDLLSGWEGAAAAVEPAHPPVRGSAHEEDDSNQAQIVVMHDAPREADDASMLERVVASVLSGGMSGRLFVEVREKRGLCYHVSAGYAPGRDHGTVTAYVGTTPDRAQESLDVLWAELNRISGGGSGRSDDGGVEADEFARAVVGMKSRLVFSGESTAARAAHLASDYFKLGRSRTLAEIAEAVDRITLGDVNAYVAGRSLGEVTIQTLGPSPLAYPA